MRSLSPRFGAEGEPFLNWHETVSYPAKDPLGKQSFTIERAGPDNFHNGDDKRVIQLIQQVDGKPVSALETIGNRETAYLSRSCYTLLVRDPQNQIIGSGYLTSLKYRYPALADTALLGHLYVHPQHQGQGIASRLTDMRIAAARKLGYRYLVLFTNNPKIDAQGHRPGIATRRGFQYVGENSRYRCYALPLETTGLIPAERRESFRTAFQLQ